MSHAVHASTEQYRHECEVRAVINMRTDTERSVHLEEVERRRGASAAKRLREGISALLRTCEQAEKSQTTAEPNARCVEDSRIACWPPYCCNGKTRTHAEMEQDARTIRAIIEANGWLQIVTGVAVDASIPCEHPPEQRATDYPGLHVCRRCGAAALQMAYAEPGRPINWHRPRGAA